jgi:hypothetical protein
MQLQPPPGMGCRRPCGPGTLIGLKTQHFFLPKSSWLKVATSQSYVATTEYISTGHCSEHYDTGVSIVQYGEVFLNNRKAKLVASYELKLVVGWRRLSRALEGRLAFLCRQLIGF